jgi:hypothetical protein
MHSTTTDGLRARNTAGARVPTAGAPPPSARSGGLPITYDLRLVSAASLVLAALVAGVDAVAVRQRLARVPARLVGGLLVGVGFLATAGSMALVVPAFGDPASVDPLLHARWIVDLTVGTPVLFVGGVLLWRRTGLGYATAAGLLFLSGVNGLAFALGGGLGALLTATRFEASVIAVHLAIAAVCLAVAAFYLRDARPASGAGSLRLDGAG